MEKKCGEEKPITYLEHNEEVVDEVHHLWSTPVITAKPFDDAFLDKLEADVQYLLKPGAPGTFNHTDLWDLPDLPETLRHRAGVRRGGPGVRRRSRPPE